jgi:hypothetical protein
MATEIFRGLIASRTCMDMRGVAWREDKHPVCRHRVTISGNTETDACEAKKQSQSPTSIF